MVPIAFRHQGTVDKFVGDALMAVFGAPLPSEDHALRAVRCAVEMCHAVERLKSHWASAGVAGFDIGIGIHTGVVVAGCIGSEDRMEYTVIGSAVNTASRIEGANKMLGTQILISHTTYEAVKEHIASSGPHEVTVANTPVEVYAVLKLADDVV